MVTARSNRKMWFGTKDYADFIETPRQGADVSPVAWGASGTTLNGSGYAFNSYNSHKEYQFSWGSTAAREAAQTMKSYFDGSFGRGKLYFQDPLTYDTNVLPARWADPSITADFEGPQLVPGVDPTTTPTSNFQYLKLPVRTAVFDLSGTQPVTGTTFVPEAENLFTNPNLVGSGTWAEVRRNLLPNPSFEVGTTGWVGSRGLLEWNPEALTTGTGSAKLTTTETGTPSQATALARAGWSAVAPGTRVFASAEIDAEHLAYITIQFRDSSGAVIQATSGDALTGRERVTHTTVAPANAVEWRVIVYHAVYQAGTGAIAPPLGSVLKVDDVYQGSAGPYFDGSSPDFSVDPDMRTRWLGAENASESVMEIETVRGLTDWQGIAGVSSWEGKPAIRQIATSSTGTASTYFNIPAIARPLGTILATSHVSKPLTGTLSPTRMQPRAQVPNQTGDTPPNEAGTYPQKLVYNGLTGTFRAELFHGGRQGSGDVWWTDIGLFAGDYDGPWFAGDSEIPGKVTRWTGTPNNSTSQIGHLVPTSTPNLNDDNSVFVPIPDGMQLNIGAFYTATSNNSGVFVSNATQGGSVGSSLARLNQVSPNSTNLTPNVFTKAPGDIGVYVWIGKTAAGSQTVSLTAIHARLSPIGEAPKGEHRWLGGQGNAGVRFTQPPSYLNHTGVNGGQVEFAATFKESIL